MAGGDYTRKRVIHQDRSTTANFAATDGNTTLITGKTNYTIVVQRIVVTIKTSAAQSMTFEDSTAGTPVYVAKIQANPGVDSRWDFDFGPEGKALATSKNLVLTMTAGNAGHVEVLAFAQPDAVATA
jgi:hypothetical protein